MTASSPRVLLVEDEAPIRRFVGAALANAHYQLDEAGSAEQALQHGPMHWYGTLAGWFKPPVLKRGIRPR